MYQVSKYIGEFLHSPVPQELWHYTTMAGLEGILSSGKMWATEARFTSDETEYVFAKQVLLGYLNLLSPSDSIVRTAIGDLKDAIELAYRVGPLSREFVDVFVASFSAAEDLKSQWHEYGEAYRGVCIALDLTHSRPPLEIDTSVTLAPCVYDRGEQQRLLRSAVDTFMSYVDSLLQDSEWNRAVAQTWPIVARIYGPLAKDPPYRFRGRPEIMEILQQGYRKMIKDLFVLTSHCKNPTFIEEQEWRLVLPRSRQKDSARLPVKYRSREFKGATVQAPYIELELDENSEKAPITRVMTGPKGDPAKVKSILDQYGYDVPVFSSGLPIR